VSFDPLYQVERNDTAGRTENTGGGDK